MSLYSDFEAEYAFEMDYPFGLPSEWWTKRDGSKIRVADMTAAHIENCMRLVGEDDAWYHYFMQELNKRKGTGAVNSATRERETRKQAETCLMKGDKNIMKKVIIHTDGACSGNPGPGGWAAVLQYGELRKELAGNKPHTTNNRMELAGVFYAIRALKEPCEITVCTDSSYVVNNWPKLASWKRSGWTNSVGKPIANADCWSLLFDVIARGGHKVRFEKVEGHANDDLNNLCDLMAKRQVADLKISMKDIQVKAVDTIKAMSAQG